LQPFGRHLRDRAHLGVCHEVVGLDALRNPEVCQFDCSFGVEQDVVGFDVTVDLVHDLVDVDESVQQLVYDSSDDGFWNECTIEFFVLPVRKLLQPGDDRMQTAPVHLLEQNLHLALILECTLELDQEGTHVGTQNVEVSDELLAFLLVLGVDGLDCDQFVRLYVAGQLDLGGCSPSDCVQLLQVRRVDHYFLPSVELAYALGVDHQVLFSVHQ